MSYFETSGSFEDQDGQACREARWTDAFEPRNARHARFFGVPVPEPVEPPVPYTDTVAWAEYHKAMQEYQVKYTCRFGCDQYVWDCCCDCDEHDEDEGRDWYDEDEDLIDGVGFAREGSALRRETRDNPRDCACPTCGRKNVLTRLDRQRGYQCDRCADAAESGRDYDDCHDEQDEYEDEC